MLDDLVDLKTITSLCKRRGFLFQSSEIYGGLASTWDYGPLGVELKNNIKTSWWKNFVWSRNDIVGLDSAILMHPDVWKVSGHVENFSDPLVDCISCRKRWREDQLESKSCPDCGGALTDVRQFNLMFETNMGPIKDDNSNVYLRPETAQGIFVNFENVMKSMRLKLPFGIAQLGKAFRNEITTGNFIFRTREFEMMEIEYFVNPENDQRVYDQWVTDFMNWYKNLGMDTDKLRIREHDKGELAHYAKATSDIEYQFPWGWGEIQGIANRTDYDLQAHSKQTGQKLSYFDEKLSKHIVPYVIEPSAGVDRIFMAILLDSYQEEVVSSINGKSDTRIVLKLTPELAPIKVAVLPLSRKDVLSDLATQIYKDIKSSAVTTGVVEYDDSQSIGKRYRRQDEIGTPICVTIDFDSLDDKCVTLRFRDTMEQIRIPISDLIEQIRLNLNNG
ncbi:MAG: glycine--tRNA ligase [SAR202 cluster bacterium]|nr:glycine--tRNA ligase [SAR202 cluster bacterium]|tara:strand:- start:42985 stop:44322 length:1338 start_codon:yes stop_codon:yes gene_type:complete